jgi:hypothetical protein
MLLLTRAANENDEVKKYAQFCYMWLPKRGAKYGTDISVSDAIHSTGCSTLVIHHRVLIEQAK